MANKTSNPKPRKQRSDTPPVAPKTAAQTAAEQQEERERLLSEHFHGFLQQFAEARAMAVGNTPITDGGKYFRATVRSCFKHYYWFWDQRDANLLVKLVHNTGMSDIRTLGDEMKFLHDRATDFLKQAQAQTQLVEENDDDNEI